MHRPLCLPSGVFDSYFPCQHGILSIRGEIADARLSRFHDILACSFRFPELPRVIYLYADLVSALLNHIERSVLLPKVDIADTRTSRSGGRKLFITQRFVVFMGVQGCIVLLSQPQPR